MRRNAAIARGQCQQVVPFLGFGSTCGLTHVEASRRVHKRGSTAPATCVKTASESARGGERFIQDSTLAFGFGMFDKLGKGNVRETIPMLD